jgi:nitrite reductase/ring-hydroxylating ferredoxin subunit
MPTEEPRDRSAPGAPGSDDDACAGCTLVGRREFLRDTLVATAAAIGVPPALASGMPVGFIAPIARSAVEKSYPIPTADSIQIDKAEDTIVARWQGKAYVFSLACPHQSTAIRWQADRRRFECPKHKSHYTPDGTFVDGRATRGLDRFAVRREGNTIVVNLDLLYEEDRQREQWRAAFVAL